MPRTAQGSWVQLAPATNRGRVPGPAATSRTGLVCLHRLDDQFTGHPRDCRPQQAGNLDPRRVAVSPATLGSDARRTCQPERRDRSVASAFYLGPGVARDVYLSSHRARECGKVRDETGSASATQASPWNLYRPNGSPRGSLFDLPKRHSVSEGGHDHRANNTPVRAPGRDGSHRRHGLATPMQNHGAG
jgi:hypothetical protein